MADRFEPPSMEAVARLRALAERPLTPDEVAAGLRARLNPQEIDERRELIRWFRHRYPTPGERLAYARRAYARWSRGMPEAIRRSTPTG